MIKDNGTIIWDDYGYPGVWKYVTELATERSDRQFIYIYGWDKVVMLPSGLL